VRLRVRQVVNHILTRVRSLHARRWLTSSKLSRATSPRQRYFDSPMAASRQYLGAVRHSYPRIYVKIALLLLQTILDSRLPPPDVAAGTTKDEQIAADLVQVIRGTAPDE